MKKLLLTYLTIAFLFTNIQAQEVELEWAFPQGGDLIPFSTFEDWGGNIYVVGCYKGIVDFNPGPLETIVQSSNGWGADLFIQKLTPNRELIWIKTIVGQGIGEPMTGAVDIEGNIYITSEFSGEVDFDPSPASEQLRTSSNGSSNFILKLNPAGNFNWVKIFKGGGITSLKPDSNGNMLITGYFSGNIVFDQQNIIEGVGECVYIAKINPNGNFEWIRRNTMNSLYPIPLNISIDENNNTYGVSKYLNSTSINHGTSTETLLTTSEENDTYLYKLNQEGEVQWVKSFQDSTINVTNIKVDSDDIFLSGNFTGSVDFDLNNTDFTLSTETSELFLVKYSNNAALDWGVNFGKGEEVNDTYCNQLNTDKHGNIYVGGIFKGSTSLDPSNPQATYTTQEERIVFLSKFNNDGDYLWSNRHESTGISYIKDMFIDYFDNIYILNYLRNSMAYDPNDPSLFFWGSERMIFQKINQLSPSSSFNINNVTNIDIFPNPTSDIINITSQEEITSIKVINNLGQIIGLYNDIKSNAFTCSLGENPGLFYLQITSKENTITRPIIKE